jgi:hypothetical protein
MDKLTQVAALVVGVAMVILAGCDRATDPAAKPAPVASATPHVYRVHDWPMPITRQAAQPDLIAASDGRLLLSWIEPRGNGHALRFAEFKAGRWSAPRDIATGANWFVNWADTPHLAATDDGALWAHWLQKSAAATYAYDVAMVRSGDGGATWSAPTLVNDDGKAAEHGFVSLWPATRDSVGVTWLDGRNSGGEHAGHGGNAGAMTLRAARFDAGMQRSDESEIDAMTCDCCQTDIAMTARGPLLVYRDRNHDEIRDIAVTRGTGAAWTPPHLVHADGWKMPACPVNGPAIAARGNDAVVAWYTAPGDKPMLRIAHSIDAGDTFSAPLTVDEGAEVQGRVDTALDSRSAWVLWIREEAGGQSLQLARYARDLSGAPERNEVGKIEGRGRATGFPQLTLGGDVAHVVWTDIVDGKPRLRGAMLRSD